MTWFHKMESDEESPPSPPGPPKGSPPALPPPLPAVSAHKPYGALALYYNLLGVGSKSVCFVLFVYHVLCLVEWVAKEIRRYEAVSKFEER